VANWKKLVLCVGSSLVGFFGFTFGVYDFLTINSKEMSYLLGSTELGWSYRSKFNYLITASIPLSLGASSLVFSVRFLRRTEVRSLVASLVCTSLLLTFFFVMRAISLAR
jgi:hypothetical protein